MAGTGDDRARDRSGGRDAGAHRGTGAARAVIDLDPTTGERTGSLLTTLAATRATNRAGEPFFGVYAEVV